MSYFVYILKSESTSQYYVGYTNDINRRVLEHNDPAYHGTRHTKRNKGPWTCIYTEQFDTRPEAMQREKEIKAKKSRAYIKFLMEGRQSPEGIRD